MAKRTRNVPVLFWVSPQEMELIRQKMAQFGTDNLSAYLRKMAIDGYAERERQGRLSRSLVTKSNCLQKRFFFQSYAELRPDVCQGLNLLYQFSTPTTSSSRY